MTCAANIAKALRGQRCGEGFLVRCPVRGHGKGKGDRRPSLVIRDGDTALLVNCYAGCDRRDVLDTLRGMGLLDGDRTSRPTKPVRRDPPREPEPDPDALAIWHGTEPIGGTVAETYLREHRAIGLDHPVSLRFHPCAGFPRTGTTFPALVAAVARPDRKVVAVQLTYLRPDGQKAPVSAPRLTFGSMGTGAIRLAPVDGVLGLAEGTENALSAMELTGVPCWSTLGAKRLGRITLPDSVREVHLFVDCDGAGKVAAERAADIYTRAGRKVLLRWPPEGCGDWNDAARTRKAVAA